MKIVVCAKRVPDSAAKIRPAADGKGIDPQGVEQVISPYDEIALECAVQLKEAGTATSITMLSLSKSGSAGSSNNSIHALVIGGPPCASSHASSPSGTSNGAPTTEGRKVGLSGRAISRWRHSPALIVPTPYSAGPSLSCSVA